MQANPNVQCFKLSLSPWNSQTSNSSKNRAYSQPQSLQQCSDAFTLMESSTEESIIFELARKNEFVHFAIQNIQWVHVEVDARTKQKAEKQKVCLNRIESPSEENGKVIREMEKLILMEESKVWGIQLQEKFEEQRHKKRSFVTIKNKCWEEYFKKK